MNGVGSELSGGAFVLIYMIVVFVVLLACYRYARSREPSCSLAPLGLPASIDVYETAYLHGGENALTRVITVALAERGHLVATERGLRQAQERPLRLTAMEQTVYDFIAAGRSGENVFKSDLPRRVRSYCLGYEERIQQERLLTEQRHKSLIRRTASVGVIVIAAASAWLVDALDSSAGYAIFVAAVTLFSAVALYSTDRLSARGKAYLAMLKSSLRLLTDASASRYALMAAVLGVGALVGTPFEAFAKIYPTAASWSASIDVGCGDSGCGGCGGCGCGD